MKIIKRTVRCLISGIYYLSCGIEKGASYINSIAGYVLGKRPKI